MCKTGEQNTSASADCIVYAVLIIIVFVSITGDVLLSIMTVNGCMNDFKLWVVVLAGIDPPTIGKCEGSLLRSTDRLAISHSVFLTGNYWPV